MYLVWRDLLKYVELIIRGLKRLKESKRWYEIQRINAQKKMQLGYFGDLEKNKTVNCCKYYCTSNQKCFVGALQIN